MSALSAGTVLGPAIGGWLVSSVGITPTFCVVGGLFLVNAVYARYLTAETSPERRPRILVMCVYIYIYTYIYIYM